MSVMTFYVTVLVLAGAGTIGMGISMVQADYTYTVDVTTDPSIYGAKRTRCEDGLTCWIVSPSGRSTDKFILGVQPYLKNSNGYLKESDDVTMDLCNEPEAGSIDKAIFDIANAILASTDINFCPFDGSQSYAIYENRQPVVTLTDQLACDDYVLELDVYDRYSDSDVWKTLGYARSIFTISENCTSS